jgi:hypothetical protein
LHGREIVINGIVVSESGQSVGLPDTIESIGQFVGADVPVYALPRLSGRDEEKWCAAPALIALCTDEYV